jgi:CheY-like chemotaxis protein
MERLLDGSARGAVQLRIEPEDEPLFVEGEATQIRQVVVNLVNNAWEAYGGAPGPVTIRTGRTLLGPEELAAADASWAEPGREYVYLEVSDQGVGICETVRQRMFDPFATTKFVGRGLGLSVVMAIVRSHAGAISVTNTTGQGTTFRVFFPAASAPAEESRTRTAAKSASVRDATVLVVDDDEAVLELAQIFLSRAGVHVRTASSGREALELLLERSEAVDAVVLDLAMPDVDGREVLDALVLERPDLSVILTSGYDHKAVEQQLDRACSSIPFLQKPYTPEDLVERVQKAIADPAALRTQGRGDGITGS